MKNFVQEGEVLDLTIAAGCSAGAPVLVGGIKGVAQVDITAADSGPCRTCGVFDLAVQSVNDSGNSAVAIGDKLYYTAGDTVKLSKKASGTFWGYALETVGSGLTDTINVELIKGGNLVSPAAGSVPAAFVVIAAGKFTTTGGDANETITVTGAVAGDIAIVTMQTQGTGSRTILSAIPGTDKIDVVLSGDPSTNHILSYLVLRAVS